MTTKKSSPDKTLELSGYSKNNIHKIIRPDLRFTVTRYFVERWIPVLGLYANGFVNPRRSAGQAAGRSALLITDLRQFILWNKGKPVHISQRKLSERHRLSERTIRTLLAEPLVGWFIKAKPGAYYPKDGKTLRSSNKYIVRMDEPLTPQDVEFLISIVEQKRSENPASAPKDILLWLLSQPRETLLASHATTAIKKTELFSKGTIHLLDVMQKLFPEIQLGREEELLANRLETFMISPNDVLGDSKYFRESWMPLLGAGAGWLLFILRNKGYLNERKGIERNQIDIENIETYSRIISVSNTQILYWIKNDLQNWIEILTEKKLSNQKISRTLRVNLHTPLTPDDERKVALDVLGKVAGTSDGVLKKVAGTGNRVSPKVAGTLGRVPRKVAEIQSPYLKTQKTLKGSHQHQSQTVQKSPPPVAVVNSKKKASPLPEEIKTGLRTIGWVDSLDEIARAYQADAPLVTAWLTYTQSLPQKEIHKSRAALFRHGVRTGQQPPKAHSTQTHRDYFTAEAEDEEEIIHTLPPNADPQLMPLWQLALSPLKQEISPANFKAYLQDSYPLTLDGNHLKVHVENQDTQDWLEDRLQAKLEKLLIGVFGKMIGIEFITEGKKAAR